MSREGPTALENLNRLSFKTVSSERIELPTFSTIILKPTLKLIFNSSILIKVSNWDLKRALDRLNLQKVHFNSGPSDVQLTLDAVYRHPSQFSVSEVPATVPPQPQPYWLKI